MVLEKTLESSQDSKEIKPVNPKGNQHWILIGRTDAEAQILWPPDVNSWLIGKCWERLKAGEGGDKGWDGWMASPTQWTWVWADSGRWWRSGRPGVLQLMGLQRVRHGDWTTGQERAWQICLKWQYEKERGREGRGGSGELLLQALLVVPGPWSQEPSHKAPSSQSRWERLYRKNWAQGKIY